MTVTVRKAADSNNPILSIAGPLPLPAQATFRIFSATK